MCNQASLVSSDFLQCLLSRRCSNKSVPGIRRILLGQSVITLQALHWIGTDAAKVVRSRSRRSTQPRSLGRCNLAGPVWCCKRHRARPLGSLRRGGVILRWRNRCGRGFISEISFDLSPVVLRTADFVRAGHQFLAFSSRGLLPSQCQKPLQGLSPMKTLFNEPHQEVLGII